MIEPDHPRLSIVRQCELASISRSSFYRLPTAESEATLGLMRLIDEQFLETTWYGSRQMARHLRRNGWCVGRHRVRRLHHQEIPHPPGTRPGDLLCRLRKPVRPSARGNQGVVTRAGHPSHDDEDRRRFVRSIGDHTGAYQAVDLIDKSGRESSRAEFLSKKSGILDANGDTLRQRYGDHKSYPR
jgi:HTH-like domain